MRTCLIAFVLAAVLAGTAHAQSVACRDGTVLTGPMAERTCVTHGGPPQAGATGRGDPFAPDAQPGRTRGQAQPPRLAGRNAGQQPALAPGGGPGQVWVNSGSKVYHCQGDRDHGKTRRGECMAEAAAKAARAHGVGGKACS